MLTISNGAIYESAPANNGVLTTTTGTWCEPNSHGTYYWNSYPVYVTTDKTAKAIAVLKALQDERLLDCKSVPKFIELVEKISRLL